MTSRTPYPVISASRLRRNILDMQALASHAGVRLWPHAKTHKSPVIARMQIEAGAVGICCAKLGEAEVFADHGITDIRLPYPVNPTNADRVMALLDRVRLSIIVDDEDVAGDWSAILARAGKSLDVLVKIDVGFHRCGMDPAAPDLVDRIARIAALPGAAFRGILSHAGHAYHATSPFELAAIAAAETDIMIGLAGKLRTAGVPVEEISVGSTPTASFARCATFPGKQSGRAVYDNYARGTAQLREKAGARQGTAGTNRIDCFQILAASVRARSRRYSVALVGNHARTAGAGFALPVIATPMAAALQSCRSAPASPRRTPPAERDSRRSSRMTRWGGDLRRRVRDLIPTPAYGAFAR